MYNENYNTPQLHRTEIKADYFLLLYIPLDQFDFENYFPAYIFTVNFLE